MILNSGQELGCSTGLKQQEAKLDIQAHILFYLRTYSMLT